jgi:hypothetical protein
VSDFDQPEYAWVHEWKGLSRLFLVPQQRQDIADGRSRRVFVFPWGFTWINRADEFSAKWSDVACTFHLVTQHSHEGTPTFTSYCYTVQLAGGRTASIRGWLAASKAAQSQAVALQPTPGVTTPVTVEQLGRLVESGVTHDQFPRAIGSFNAGQPVSFGPVAVGRTGIGVGSQLARWSEIQGVRTRAGYVQIKKLGKRFAWKTVPVSIIPNYFVFDALVHAVLPHDKQADPREAASRIRES